LPQDLHILVFTQSKSDYLQQSHGQKRKKAHSCKNVFYVFLYYFSINTGFYGFYGFKNYVYVLKILFKNIYNILTWPKELQDKAYL